MNNMTKIALVSASLLSMAALTACQSTNTAKEADQPQKMHGQKHERNLTPEQRQQMKQMRAERQEVMKQIKQACDGKATGTAVQVKAGDKAIDGTCTTVFKADHNAMKSARGEHKPMKGNHHPMRGDMNGAMHMQRGEPLTDAKRAELTKQFDQRLAERQAKQQAVLKVCQGKADGTAVQIKVGTQTIDGKCEIRFQPKMPVQSTPAQVKAT